MALVGKTTFQDTLSASALYTVDSEKSSSLLEESSTKEEKIKVKKLAQLSSVLSEVSTKRTSSTKGKKEKKCKSEQLWQNLS
jgi:hypothetical protein